MKKLFILCLCNFIFLYAPAQLKEIFYDDFSTNKNQWSQGQAEGLYAKIENGKYVVECGPKNELYPQIVFGIDSTKDYSISINFSLSKSLLPNCGGGIIWGSNLSDYFCFYITSEGKAGVAEVKNKQIVYDKWDIIKQVIKTGDGATNKLRIEKTDLNWDFYINDQFIAVLPSQRLNGLFVGLAALPGARYVFDDLKISGTPIVTTGSFCQLFPLIYESSKNKFSFIMGMKTEKNQFACLNYQSPDNIMTLDVKGSTSLLDYSIKKFPTREEGIKGIKEFIAEQEKCLPGFQFTEDKTTNGEIKYKITEKAPKERSIITSQISLEGSGPVNIFLTIVSMNKR